MAVKLGPQGGRSASRDPRRSSTLAPQGRVDAPEAVVDSVQRDFLDPKSKRIIERLILASIVQSRAVEANEQAGSPPAIPILLSNVADEISPHRLHHFLEITTCSTLRLRLRSATMCLSLPLLLAQIPQFADPRRSRCAAVLVLPEKERILVDSQLAGDFGGCRAASSCRSATEVDSGECRFPKARTSVSG